MMNYHELLKRARQNLPITTETVRFEIPKAIVEHSGKQTIIKNFMDIAKALRREPQHLSKWLFKELAIPGAIIGSSLQLQGKIQPDLINRRIQEYAKEFVLCGECGKPDTTLQRRDRLWFLRCEACGASRPVSGL
jgi:translation initiation factor 2 subunit 2